MRKTIKSINILVAASLFSSSLIPLATAMERTSQPDPLSGHNLAKEQMALFEQMMAAQVPTAPSAQTNHEPDAQPHSTLQAIWDNSSKVWKCYSDPNHFVKASIEDFVNNYTGNILTEFLKGGNDQLELNAEAIARFLTIVGGELQEKAFPIIAPLFHKPKLRLENGSVIEYYDLGEKDRTFFSNLADVLIPSYVTGRQIIIAGLNNERINSCLIEKMNQYLLGLFFKLYEAQTKETVTESLTKLLGSTTNKAIDSIEAFPAIFSKLVVNGVQLSKTISSLIMDDYPDVIDLPRLSVDENEAQLSPIWSYFKPHIDELARNAIHSLVTKSMEGTAQLALEKVIGPHITNWALINDRQSLLDVSGSAGFNIIMGSYVSSNIGYNYLGNIGFILGGLFGAAGGVVKSSPNLIKYFGPQILATSVKAAKDQLLSQYVPNIAEYISYSAVPQDANGYSLYHQYNHQWEPMEISAFPEDFKRVQRLKSTYFVAELLKSLVSNQWFRGSVDSVTQTLESSAQTLWKNIKTLIGSEIDDAQLSADDIMRLLDKGRETSAFSTASDPMQTLLNHVQENPTFLKGLVRPYWAEQERLKRLSMEWNLCSKGDLEKKLRYLTAAEQKAERGVSQVKINSSEVQRNLSNHFTDSDVQSTLGAVLNGLNWNSEAKMYLIHVAQDQNFMDSFMEAEETKTLVQDLKKQSEASTKEATARKLLDRLVTSYHQQGQGVYALLKEKFSDNGDFLANLDDLKKTSFWQEICLVKNSAEIVEDLLLSKGDDIDLLRHLTLGANNPGIAAKYRAIYQQRVADKVSEMIEFQKRNTIILFCNETLKPFIESNAMEIHKKGEADFRKNMLEFIFKNMPVLKDTVSFSNSKQALQGHIKKIISDVFDNTKQRYEREKLQETVVEAKQEQNQGIMASWWTSSVTPVSNEIKPTETILAVNHDWEVEDFKAEDLVIKELQAFKAETKFDGESFYLSREFNKLLTSDRFVVKSTLEDICSSQENQKTLSDHLIEIRSAASENQASELLSLMINDPYYNKRVFLAPFEMGQKINKLKHDFLHNRKR